MRLISFCAAAGAGCTVGPDYRRPDVRPPASWGGAKQGGVTDAPADVARWWKTFGDPVLDALVERAARANLDLQAAGARIRQARAQRGIVTGNAWPEIDAGAAYERRRRSENGGFPGGGSGGSGAGFSGGSPQNLDQSLFETGFDMSWEIDLFGRLKRGVEAADADLAAAVEARRDVLVILLAEVGRTYVTLRGLERRLAVARGAAEIQEQTTELIRSRYTAGVASDLDVAAAESRLARVRAEIPALETGRKRALHRLAVLVGENPETPEELLLVVSTVEPLAVSRVEPLAGSAVDPLAASGETSEEDPTAATAGPSIPAGPPEVPAGLPSDLLRRRPDLRRAERELAAATARIGVATSDLFPRISLTGSLGLQSQNFSDLFSTASHYWIVSPSVSWPIFEAGKIRSNIRLQEARQEEALARYRQAVLIAFEETENALAAYAREQERRWSLAEAVAAAERAAGYAEARNAQGLTDFLTVLDAQRDLYDMRDALVQSDAAVAADRIVLYKALGGGWEAPE